MTTTTEILAKAIRATIYTAKREGTVGMSYACLMQNTPTAGLTCHPSEYHRAFPRVAETVARTLRFELYN